MKMLDHKLKLRNGVEIPIIGLGTYKMKDETETYNAVIIALKNGYRHIDTAQVYENETIIGKAIKASGVPREKLFITSKIWNSNHKYDKALAQVDEILKRLGLEYLDLCLIHWATKDRNECYRALETAYKTGKIKAIGVSNYEVEHLEELMKLAEIKPMVNQIELHPGLNNTKVVEYCQKNDIVVESWSTMMQGKCDLEPVLIELAAKYDKNPGQICLKWALQQNIVIIPKSVHEERIIANTQLDDFTISTDDMIKIFELVELRMGPDPKDVNF